ncbi:MAG: ATP-binding cassette domain-containing protein [Erysipelotrichaceae bacterium]|nr:ATP-binding cassette domain-containing protein [Erysipelotrichaceae bacterium]
MKLVVKHLNKTIKHHSILQDINCTIDNHIYGLLGPNGCGKTTFIRCLLKLMNSQGEISYFDNDQKLSIENITIGYLPQTFNIFKELTVREQLEYFATLKNIPKASQDKEIERVLKLVNMYKQKDLHGSSLSGGMIRRVGIAQALLGKPQMIIFDEPTAGLDPDERNRFKSILQQFHLNIPIIISTHIISDISSLCSHVIFMNEGEIVKSGDINELLSEYQKDDLEDLYQFMIHGDHNEETIFNDIHD